MVTGVSETHIFWTIFKQCDNLGLSVQSYLGCISSARAGKASVTLSSLENISTI